ncbi:MAG: NAD-dependent epimerase/dehydratase family protein [candidate division Zixibacteria bacterium]|nr:NAD-dependent epimerase/dehydratase family protein [candidate division Zixibacteria bacterium]
MNLTDKKILITGASGSLGKQLCYQFNLEGVKPIAHVRESSNTDFIDSLGLEKRVTDLRQTIDLVALLEGIDSVIHTAAWVNFRRDKLTQFTGINTFGAVDLYKAARQTGVRRFLHISTVGAVGALPHRAVNGDVLSPLRASEEMEYNLGHLKIPYFMTKRAAEEELFKLAAEGRPELVVVNPTIIVAPSRSGDDRSIAYKLFSKLVFPEYDNLVNLVDIRDLAPGIICALEKSRPGERYILGGENISLKDLVLNVSAIVDRAPHLVHFPRPLVNALARLSVFYNRLRGRGKISFYPDLVKLLDFDWAYSSQRARKELGYRTRSVFTTLEDLLTNSFYGTWLKPKAPAGK